MILVDTSVWIDFLRGVDSKECLTLQNLINNEADIVITEIILTEILQGISSDSEYKRIKDYLLEIPIDKPTSRDTYIKAAEIYRACRKKGKTVSKTTDCIIASISIENNRTLLHKDKDFDRIAQCSRLKILRLSPKQ